MNENNLYNLLRDTNEKQLQIEVTILEIKTADKNFTFQKIFVANTDKETLRYSLKYAYKTEYKDFSKSNSGHFSSLESMYLDFVNKFKI